MSSTKSDSDYSTTDCPAALNDYGDTFTVTVILTTRKENSFSCISFLKSKASPPRFTYPQNIQVIFSHLSSNLCQPSCLKHCSQIEKKPMRILVLLFLGFSLLTDIKVRTPKVNHNQLQSLVLLLLFP